MTRLFAVALLAATAGAEAALDALADARALVFDLRPCIGGDEMLAQRVAGRFTDREVAYAKARVRDPTVAGRGFRPAETRTFAPLAKGRRDARRIVVLQGPYTVSSAEGFVLMLRALDTVTTVGLSTRGASGNPKPFRLFDDVTVWASTWESLTLDGRPLERVGIPPDVRDEADPLGRALALLGAR